MTPKKPLNAFIFASGFNKEGRTDASGAFVPHSREFKRIHKIPQNIFYFNHSHHGQDVRDAIWHKLLTVDCADPDGLDAVVYFGHGWEHGLSSASFNDGVPKYGSQDQVEALAMAISAVSKDNVRVIFYACKAGWLGDSFASKISQALHCKHAKVFAHELVPGGSGGGNGHTICNPYVTVWEKNKKGRYLIPKTSEHWSAWFDGMQAAKNGHELKHQLWAQFPFMTDEELVAGLKRGFSWGSRYT
jgi:hypothetical protein